MKTNQRKSRVKLLPCTTIGLAVMFLFAIPHTVSAQWSPDPNNNNNIYYNAGNVGIGTTAPGTRLNISGGQLLVDGASSYPQVKLAPSSGHAILDIVRASSSTGENGVRFMTGTTNNYEIYVPPNTSDLRFYSGGDKVTFQPGGNVGIGTTGPNEKLDVNGFGLFEGGIVTGGVKLQANGGISSIVLSADNSGATDYVAVGDISNNFTGTQLFAGGGAKVTVLSSNGNVGIGTQTPGSKLDVNGNTNISGNINVAGNGTTTGNITLDGTIHAKYQDVAEWVLTSEQIPMGTVVVLDTIKSNQVISSTHSYDTRVAGVVSERPGLALGEGGAGKVLVATTGRVLVKVDASNGPIHIGDLLVTSDISGMAMKSVPITIGNRKMHMPGTLIGKALEPIEKGSGKILVLLSLQ